MSSAEPRCPNCNALISIDAEWCGQCYEPLRARPEIPGAETGSSARGSSLQRADSVGPEFGPTTTSSTASTPRVPLSAAAPSGIERTEAGTTWTCPVCGERNEISLNRCGVCGASFARLFEEPAPRPAIVPNTALIASLVLPGLGHWLAGRRGDGVARMILFVWLAGTVLVLAASRSGKGLGPIASLFALFLVGAAVLWLESALDAHRVASGIEPVVSSRGLLWASAGFVVLSAIVATIVALPATHGR